MTTSTTRVKGNGAWKKVSWVLIGVLYSCVLAWAGVQEGRIAKLEEKVGTGNINTAVIQAEIRNFRAECDRRFDRIEEHLHSERGNP